MTKANSDSPRVIFIGPVPPPHIGPTLATVVLLESTLKDQFELIHLDTSDPRDIESLGAIDFTNIWLGIKSYFQLFFLLICYRPRLVYIPISQTTVGYLRDSIYIWMSRAFFCKVVCHLRGAFFREWIDNANPLTRAFVKLSHRRIHGQIVLGKCLKPLFDGYVDRDRMHVVPNGKDCDVTPISAQTHKQPGKPAKVLFLANIIRTKGVLDVLESARILNSDEIEFVFAGAWHEPVSRKEIEYFLEENKRLRITWLGSVSGEKKRQTFEDADIFVFPTYYPPEGHPWVLIEAMAAGLPIITTDQGAIRESVIDGVNGFLIEKQNPAQLAEKVQQLADNETLRDKMGRASRQRYEEEFTEARMVEKMAAAFWGVLGGRGESRVARGECEAAVRDE